MEVLDSPLYACSNSGSDGRFDMMEMDSLSMVLVLYEEPWKLDSV